MGQRNRRTRRVHWATTYVYQSGYLWSMDKRRDLEHAAEEIDQLFADLWQVFPFSRGLRRGFRPQVDCYRTKETVVFPESMTPLAIGQERSVKLIENVVSGERLLALVTVKNEEADPPGWDDLYDVGTAAVVHKMIKVPDGTLRILVQGLRRIRLERRVQ